MDAEAKSASDASGARNAGNATPGVCPPRSPGAVVTQATPAQRGHGISRIHAPSDDELRSAAARHSGGGYGSAASSHGTPWSGATTGSGKRVRTPMSPTDSLLSPVSRRLAARLGSSSKRQRMCVAVSYGMRGLYRCSRSRAAGRFAALPLAPVVCHTPVLIPRPKSGRVVCSTQLHGTQRVCESRWCPVLTSCLARRRKSGTRYGPRCVNSCGRAPHAVVCWSRSCGAWGCDSVYRSQISMKSVSNMLIRGGCLLPWQRQRPRYAPSPRNAWTRDRAHALVSRGVGPAAGCATLVQVPYYRGPSGVDRWCSTREAGQRG